MAASEAQLRANKKYQQKFEKLQIRVSHEEKAAAEKHAQLTGESVNTFVRRAIAETMERDIQKSNE